MQVEPPNRYAPSAYAQCLYEGPGLARRECFLLPCTFRRLRTSRATQVDLGICIRQMSTGYHTAPANQSFYFRKANGQRFGLTSPHADVLFSALYAVEQSPCTRLQCSYLVNIRVRGPCSYSAASRVCHTPTERSWARRSIVI